jgi:glucose uptake protein GlcU
MEKKINLADDFILFGYVLQGVTAIFNWSVVFTYISWIFAVAALTISVYCAILSKKEDENCGKKLRKSIYYIILSIILIVICAYKAI